MNPLTKKHTQGPTERRTLKTFLSRVSLILGLQLTLFSVAWAQTPEAANANEPLLTLDEAIRIASGTNRDIHISKIEIIKAQEIVAQAKTNYLPKLDANVLAGTPLQPLNFRVPAGSLRHLSSHWSYPSDRYQHSLTGAVRRVRECLRGATAHTTFQSKSCCQAGPTRNRPRQRRSARSESRHSATGEGSLLPSGGATGTSIQCESSCSGLERALHLNGAAALTGNRVALRFAHRKGQVKTTTLPVAHLRKTPLSYRSRT